MNTNESSTTLIKLDLGVRDEISKMAAQIEEKQASIMQVKKTLRGARKEMEQLAESCKELSKEVWVLKTQEAAATAGLKELRKHESIQRSKQRALTIRLRKFQQRFETACENFLVEQDKYRKELIAQDQGQQKCTMLVLDSPFMQKLKAKNILKPVAAEAPQTPTNEITVDVLEELGNGFDIVEAFQCAAQGT